MNRSVDTRQSEGSDMEYKNTPTGKSTQRKYADILYSSRPAPPEGHPRMDILNRAKIFSPFAALRGYDNEIVEEGREHKKGSRMELSEEEKDKVSEQLIRLTKGMEVSLCYFADGFYEELSGKVAAVNPIEQKLYLYTKEKLSLRKNLPSSIPFEDILFIRTQKKE